MAKFELNIYGENDEIIKKYETDHVRWGIFMQALEAKDELPKKSPAEQFGIINDFIRKIFPGITDEDIGNADYSDIFSTFRQLINVANGIGGSKNAAGPEAK